MNEMGNRVTQIVAEHPTSWTTSAVHSSTAAHWGHDLRHPRGLRQARWHQRNERGETRPEVDLTWAAYQFAGVGLGTLILRTHVERHLPEPLATPAQLERWEASVNTLLRNGLFRRGKPSRRQPFCDRSTASLPQKCVNARVNALRLSKPTAVDVSCTDCPGAASSAIARSIRACNRYVRQGNPECVLKEPSQRPFRHRDRAADLSSRHRIQVLLRIRHRRRHDRVFGRRKAQWRLVIQRLRHQVGQCAEERVGDRIADRPVDRPSQRVDHHLPDQRRHREDAGAVTAVGNQLAGRTSPPPSGHPGSSSPGAADPPGSTPPAAAATDSAPTAVSTSTTPPVAYSIWCTSCECQPVISASPSYR